MAVISIHSIAVFFADENKLIARGENAVQSNHVVTFAYDGLGKTLSGKIQASMKDKAYEVQVSLKYNICINYGSSLHPTVVISF